MVIRVAVKNELSWHLLRGFLNDTGCSPAKNTVYDGGNGRLVIVMTFDSESVRKMAEDRIRQVQNPFMLMEQDATPKGE